MTRAEAKKFVNKIQKTGVIPLHSAVVFFYDSFAKMTGKRNILSTDLYEVKQWLNEVVNKYALINRTYVAYLDGQIECFNNGELKSVLSLFSD